MPTEEKRGEEMDSVKEKLAEMFGFFGLLLYQAIIMAYALLPFLVVSSYYIDTNWLIIVLFIAFYLFSTFFLVAGGIANTILWVWGMVIAVITGPLWFTILYAVMFVISMILFVLRLRSNNDN